MATKNIVPRSDKEGQLGTNAKQWNKVIAHTGSFQAVSSSLIPDTADTYDLGSATKFWRDLYVSSGSIKFINPANNVVVSTISVNADGNQEFSGSVIPDADNEYDLGSSSKQWKDLYINGTANIDTLTLTSGASVTSILDEDAMGSDSATALATQQSIKAYVDSQVTAQDLDFQGDSGGALSIDLDSETLDIAGDGAGISTAGSGNQITISGDHDALTNFVANEHIDHTSVTLTAGTGLTGGGDISSNRTFAVDGVLEDLDTLGAPASDGQVIVATGAGAFQYESGATLRTTIGVDASGTDNSTDVTLVTTSHDYLSLSGQAITLGTIDIGDDTNLVGGDGLTLTGDTLSVNVDDSSIETNSDSLRVKASGITNAMLAGSIADSKLSTISTANKVSIDALDIDGGTAIGEAVADADLFITDNGAGGTNRKVTASALKTYMSGVSGGSTLGNIQVGITDANELDTSSGNLTIDSAGGTTILDDNVTISGNLTVNGESTVVSSSVLDIGDRIITLNANSAAGDGGIYVNDADSAETGSLLWDVSADRWIGGLKDSEVTIPTISSTDTLTNKSINASNNTLTNIPNSALTNTNVNFGGVTVALGGSDTTPAFDLQDATGLPIVDGTTGTLSVARGGTGVTSMTNLKNALDDETWTFANKLTADAGIDIDNINIDGTTIALSSGDLTLDAAGDIVLDADGADIILKDGGTSFGRFKRDTSNLVIKSETSNTDMIFRGNDGGVTIDALTLDMSEAGAATFGGGIADAGTISAGTWNGGVIASAYLDSDTAHLSGTQTFSGDKTFSAGLTFSGLSAQNSETDVLTINGSNVIGTRQLGSNAFTSNLGSYDTDDLSEGSSNLYYTDARVVTKIDSLAVVSGSATNVRTFLNVEDGADVTDTTNVTAAGALMDSELTSIADVKALDQSVVSGATPTFTTTNFTDATNKRLMTDAQETVLDNTSNTNTGDVTLSGTPDYITISNQVITRNTIDIGDDTNLTAGTGITLTGDTLSTTDSEIVHDNLSGFVANEHIDHSGVEITAGAGLTGGGDITSTRTLAVGAGTHITVNADDVAVNTGTLIASISGSIVTTANVTAAGALMDSEVDADIKTLSLPASTTISTYGKSLIDDSDASTARTTLGLGTSAVLDTAAIANGGTGVATADQIHTFVTTQTDSTAADTSGNAATATLASTVTVSDSTSNTNFPIAFHDESNALLDDTGTFTYNPSTSTLVVPNINVSGTQTFVNTANLVVTSSVIFEGATADGYETTLTVADPTADRTITLPDATDTVALLAATQTFTNKTLTSADINTPDIDGGTIDGATIATSDITVGTGKTLDVSGGTLTLANDQISGNAINGGTIGSTTITSLTTAGITATANIDIGAYELRAQTLESDVSTGTAPLTIASTTLVSNLNADLLDGQEGSYYLDFGNFVIDDDEIPIAKLASDSVSYGGVSVTLGSSDATPAFDLSDATSLPIVDGTTGTLSVARGGTGATSLNNLITLGTHTTGNYVATITGGTGVSSTGATSGEGITHTLSIGQSVGTSDTVAFGRVNLGSTVDSDFLSGNSVMTADGYIMAKAIVNTSETGGSPAAITFGDGATLGTDEISLVTNGSNAIYIDSSQNVNIPNGNLHITTSSDPKLQFTSAEAGTDNYEIFVAASGLKFRNTSDSVTPLELHEDGDVIITGLGGSDGATGFPTLRLNNSVESADWDTGDVVGNLEFYVEDTSGNAPYVASFIKSVNPQNNGTLPGGYLSFGTCPYNQSGGATEEFRMETDGDFHAIGDVVAYSSTPSDERLKDNVVTIDSGLSLVNQLRGVTFDWNQGSKQGKKDYGVIAQEVEKVIPEVVSEKKLPLIADNDEVYKTVDYEKLTAVLIEAVKDLSKEIDDIKQKCDCLNK